LVCSSYAVTQDASKIEKINLRGREYTVSEELPQEILDERTRKLR
jgi:hypothetical protein